LAGAALDDVASFRAPAPGTSINPMRTTAEASNPQLNDDLLMRFPLLPESH
jgi:hypothetical protein